MSYCTLSCVRTSYAEIASRAMIGCDRRCWIRSHETALWFLANGPHLVSTVCAQPGSRCCMSKHYELYVWEGPNPTKRSTKYNCHEFWECICSSLKVRREVFLFYYHDRSKWVIRILGTTPTNGCTIFGTVPTIEIWSRRFVCQA